MNAINFFMITICSLLLSILFNHGVRKVSSKLNLVAYAGEHRQHVLPTPLTGGISMFSAVTFMLVVVFLLSDLSPITWSGFDNYLLAIALLVVIGVIDDRYNISFFWRFLAQIMAVFIMIQHGNALLDLGELFSNNTLSLGTFSFFMTVFATVGVINALNMSDGIDGLAASYFLIALVVLAFFSFEPFYQLIIFIWVGAILGFLTFNFPWQSNAKVFMGDAGSMVLGFTLAWLLINGSQELKPTEPLFHPIFAVWLLALPLYDTVSVMLIRLMKRKSPFHADRMHMHHHVLNRFESVKKSVFIMLLWFFVYVLIGIYCHVNEVLQFKQTIMFSVFFIMHFLFQFKLSFKKKTKETIV